MASVRTAPDDSTASYRGALSPVNDPIIAKFAEACGATAALDLRVDLAEGGRFVAGSVAMPFALVGRADACDVTLTDSEVNPRHAWLQVVGGRVLAIDLGSRTGLGWPDDRTGSGWLDVGTPVRIGPFHLRLCSPVSQRPVYFPSNYSPLQSDVTIVRSPTAATLEFRNGKRAKDRWTVNRFVTLVGRAPECKIRLSADDIAGYHCGLVLTPKGLWVVDLSGRGVVVNGERMRVSPLPAGAELWIGRFLIGLQYPTATASASARVEPSIARPAPARASSEPAEDEVPLGVVPPHDPTSGLPSSHIMADAFRLWAGAGSLSNPILVSGSESVSGAMPAQSALFDLLNAASPAEPKLPAVPPPPPPGPVTAVAVESLLRELGELHGQMLAHFQQSLVLMVRLCACLRRDQLPAMQQELARIQELNGELAQLQAELARRVATEPTTPPPPTSPPPPKSPDSTALHDLVMDRINSLQRERQARWQSLVGMFSASGG